MNYRRTRHGVGRIIRECGFRVGVIHGCLSLLSFILKGDFSYYCLYLFRVNDLRVIVERLGMLCEGFDTM
jgi:hypothetical protein